MPAMAIDPIARFEDSIQRLVEGGLARLFAGQLHARELALQITRCMEDQAIPDEGGRRHAPDIYQVRLNSEDHQTILAAHQDIAQQLGQDILQAAEAAGLIMTTVPQVRVFADSDIPPHHVHVSAQHATLTTRDVTESWTGSSIQPIGEPPHPDARLLLDGGQAVAISQPVLNIGRARDNQIILDDPTISRRHAQIRLRFGRYTLFDLGSSAGTAVNGEKIRESVLRSGDIVTIGSRTLIYVEDTPPERLPKLDDTGPLQPDLA